MLVYGDAVRTADPRQVIEGLRASLVGLEAPGPAIERHARLASLFIAAAELAQGLGDAAALARGGDGASDAETAAIGLVMQAARALLGSWRALGAGAPPPSAGRGDIALALEAVERTPLPDEVQLKTAEGYAFYALYPEGYAEAALQIERSGDVRVIGVRSIGSGLAALVAVVLGARPPVTVRPVGHPFQRRLQLLPDRQAELTPGRDTRFVIVDEGPGLSGSSFGAVADTLEGLGASACDIAFLPGHAGALGDRANAAHRRRWDAAERPCTSFEALLLQTDQPGHRLQAWFTDLAGGDQAALQEVSGGAWRALRYAAEAHWPAANTHQERRKFLLSSAAGTWLLKFSGLGASGEHGFALARRLAAASFAPDATALRYGFMAQPWVSGRPLRLGPEQRRRFAAHLGDYLGWRAAHLPAPPEAGGSLDALLEMARVNAAEALGAQAAEAGALSTARWAAAAPLRRVWTDNRLHAHEWLEDERGRWLKTDAVDHAAAHDLVGGQDIAWDVAAARVEFDLDAGEMAVLLSALRDQAEVDPDLVSLLEPAYLAFQMGAYSMAADAHAGWPQERQRLLGAMAAYRRRLSERLTA